jgi:hypothetical protein
VIDIDARITGLRKPDYWAGVLKPLRRARCEPRFSWFAKPQDVQGYIVGEVRDWEFGAPPCGWVFGIGVLPSCGCEAPATRLLANDLRALPRARRGQGAHAARPATTRWSSPFSAARA